MSTITLDETPRGVTKIHTRADAPPSSHVVSTFEATCAVGDAQDETAIRAGYRLGRTSFSSTHGRTIQRARAPSKTQNGKFDQSSALGTHLVVTLFARAATLVTSA